MSFDTFIQRVLAHEGGFVDHPSDPGGATNYGITERVARANGYAGDMRALPKSVAVAIYRKDYWEAVRADAMPAPVAFQVFDAAVNHGVDRAARWLQTAVGVAVDGRIGPQSIAAVLAMNPAKLVMRYVAIRLEFYAGLKTFPTFGRGWTRRVAGNLAHAASDA